MFYWRVALGLGACAPVTTAGLGALAAEPEIAAPPQRAAGLWEQQLTIDDGSYAIPKATMCIDAKAEQRLTLVGSQMDRTACSAYRMSKQSDGSWSFYSVCQLGQSAVVTTEGTVSGDFTTTYTVRATGTTTGAARAGMNGSHRVTINARRAGDCPAGQIGGDVTTAGKTSNVFAPAGR